MHLPPTTSLAITLGVSLSTAFTACGLTLSYMTIPSLILPPGPTATSSQVSFLHGSAARSWQFVYNIGKSIGPVAGIIGAGSYVYAARTFAATATTNRRLLYAAAAANILVAPFTAIVMARTNDELHRRADAAAVGEHDRGKMKRGGAIEEMETTELLKRWAVLNTARSALPLAAVAMAGAAMVV